MKTPQILAFSTCFVLAGCMSSGTKVDQNKLASLHPGTTTCNEAVAMLGKPNNIVIKSDGTKEIVYQYVQAQVTAVSFVPVVGSLMGGTDNEQSNFVMSCDKNGVLKDFSSSQGTTATGTGILTGQKQ